MSNNIKNIKKSIGNIITAATGAVAATTELTADITTLASKAVVQAPAILKETVSIPMSAYQGVLEQDGMDESDARAQAFKYVNQDVATTIRAVGVGSGKLAAQLWDDMDDDNDDNVNSKKEEEHRVA